MTLPVETQLAIGYALLLAAVAAALEWAARGVHRRAGQFETAGFVYHAQRDRWQCPAGQHLHRHSADLHQTRVVYRAPAQACNRCPAKPGCTDSDQGRTLIMRPDLWVSSAMARFHRGLSLALLLLANALLALEAVRLSTGGVHAPSRSALWLVAALAMVYALITAALARRFFRPAAC